MDSGWYVNDARRGATALSCVMHGTDWPHFGPRPADYTQALERTHSTTRPPGGGRDLNRLGAVPYHPPEKHVDDRNGIKDRPDMSLPLVHLTDVTRHFIGRPHVGSTSFHFFLVFLLSPSILGLAMQGVATLGRHCTSTHTHSQAVAVAVVCMREGGRAVVETM